MATVWTSAVFSGSTLFASILNFVSNVKQLFAADNFSRRHFQMHFLLGPLRVNMEFKSYFPKAKFWLKT